MMPSLPPGRGHANNFMEPNHNFQNPGAVFRPLDWTDSGPSVPHSGYRHVRPIRRRRSPAAAAGAVLLLGVVFPVLWAQNTDTQLYVVILKRPEKPLPQMPQQAADQLQKDHLANFRREFDEGKLIMAGPFTEDLAIRGIGIYRAHSNDEVTVWANSDPAVKAGRLAVELHGPLRLVNGDMQHRYDIVNLERYAMVLSHRQKTGDDHPAKQAMSAHSAYLKGMFERGKLALSGVLEGDGDYAEVLIYRTESTEAAALAAEDPLEKIGYTKAEVHDWMTSKGVLPPGLPLKQ